MNRISEIRGKLSLEKVALACEPPTTPKQVSRLEKGERRLTLEWMKRLADAFTRLGVPTSPDDLLPDEFKAKTFEQGEEKLDYHFREICDALDDANPDQKAVIESLEQLRRQLRGED